MVDFLFIRTEGKILLGVCQHKLSGYIEAENIGMCNSTYHNEGAINDYITICTFGVKSVFLPYFEHVTTQFTLK